MIREYTNTNPQKTKTNHLLKETGERQRGGVKRIDHWEEEMGNGKK